MQGARATHRHHGMSVDLFATVLVMPWSIGSSNVIEFFAYVSLGRCGRNRTSASHKDVDQRQVMSDETQRRD